MITRTWILGAPDPEMEAIERLLAAAGETHYYAAADGRRVHPGNAYVADGVLNPDGTPAPTPGGDVVVSLIECGLATVRPAYEIVRIDHHRPGDPGYGRPPAAFMSSSSIGQVISALARVDRLPDEWGAENLTAGSAITLPGEIGHMARWSDRAPFYFATINRYSDPDDYCEDRLVHLAIIPSDVVLTAAADHCLAAAYRGECPGVDPDALMQWRAQSRAAFQRRSVSEVLADVERATEALRAASHVTIAGVVVADLGNATVPEAPEAAARAGIPFLATVTERGGRRKQVLQAAPAEVIVAWMAAHPGSYGDPARGFAGRYLDV